MIEFAIEDKSLEEMPIPLFVFNNSGQPVIVLENTLRIFLKNDAGDLIKINSLGTLSNQEGIIIEPSDQASSIAVVYFYPDLSKEEYPANLIIQIDGFIIVNGEVTQEKVEAELELTLPH